jgi:hypothetical protein
MTVLSGYISGHETPEKLAIFRARHARIVASFFIGPD